MDKSRPTINLEAILIEKRLKDLSKIVMQALADSVEPEPDIIYGIMVMQIDPAKKAGRGAVWSFAPPIAKMPPRVRLGVVESISIAMSGKPVMEIDIERSKPDEPRGEFKKPPGSPGA